MNLRKFTALHRQFMSEKDPLNNDYLCTGLHDLLKELDDPREIKNPLRQDGLVYGYVAVAHSDIYNRENTFVGGVQRGDVLILQFNWDRNIVITKLPLSQNCPIPYLLRDTGVLTGYKGIWLPIFDPLLIRGFAERKIKEYAQQVSNLLSEEERWWKRKIPQS